MVYKIDKETCSGCEACAQVCPTNAIVLKQDEEGFYYPQLLKERCTSCKKCLQTCPVINFRAEKDEQLYAAACYIKHEEIRSLSTSGGIFSAISKYILECLHGHVYGVVFDKEFQTVYAKATCMDELSAIRGSKYIQCRMGTVYREVKRDLEQGSYVLFSGLPCQIEGLLAFLGEKHSHLYLLDLVCFGIASPYIWQEYLKCFHDKKETRAIFFKDKTEGWKHWKVKFVEAGKSKLFERRDNLYMNSYLSRINIRKSCFCCPFKGLYRKSDFTLADCWGEGEKNQKMNDDKGLSAILIHTQKGKELFDHIKDEIVYQMYDADILMRGNWALYQSVSEPKDRARFFEELRKNTFQEVFKKFFENSGSMEREL